MSRTTPDLPGLWVGQLHVTNRDPQYRVALGLPAPSQDSAAISLTVTFDSSATAQCPGRCLIGKLRSLSDSALAPAPPDSTITGYLTSDDSVQLYIGSCCDRGALWFFGRLKGSRIAGTWYQNFIGPGDGGGFLLLPDRPSL